MSTAVIDQAGIRRLIPHAGTMCLLDAVIAWDRQRIHCRAFGHRDPAHPLAREGRVAALHLVEYGAQAMAIHGGLSAQAGGTAAAAGVLVSVRDVHLAVARIDDVEDPLDVHAERLVASGGGWLYGFRIEAAARPLASGRVAVLPAPDATVPAR